MMTDLEAKLGEAAVYLDEQPKGSSFEITYENVKIEIQWKLNQLMIKAFHLPYRMTDVEERKIRGRVEEAIEQRNLPFSL
ncbi:hypothetical protein HC823_02540 [Candidatus Gracilibacteria bacterium]|nr:hypothetical protein [Candidatus Gracilibacteria bacterium]